MEQDIKAYNKKRTTTIIKVVACIVLLVIFNTAYRPYIYANHLYDCHVADFFPNLMSVFLTFSLAVILREEVLDQPVKAIAGIGIGFILYEVLVGFTFDWLDVAAAVVSAVLTYVGISLTRRWFASSFDEQSNGILPPE